MILYDFCEAQSDLRAYGMLIVGKSYIIVKEFNENF